MGKALSTASALAMIEMRAITIKSIQTTTHPETKMLFWILFAGSRGSINRIKIISLLKEQPSNQNQMSNELHLDYKTIKHHIHNLEKNNMVTKMGTGYSEVFFISEFLESNMELFDEIGIKLGQAN